MLVYSVIRSGCRFPTISSSRYALRAPVSPAVSPLFAALTNSPQLHDNTTTLSPAFGTLTCGVRPKSFVCHSCKKHRGGGQWNRLQTCFPFRNAVAQALGQPAQILVYESRTTGRGSPTPESPRCLEGHPRRQYNHLFALRGGIRHGHGRSENSCF